MLLRESKKALNNHRGRHVQSLEAFLDAIGFYDTVTRELSIQMELGCVELLFCPLVLAL